MVSPAEVKVVCEREMQSYRELPVQQMLAKSAVRSALIDAKLPAQEWVSPPRYRYVHIV